MKFGDTLYRRSVPKWAAYNFKYNETKGLIKVRTSAGVAVPVHIPAQGKGRWDELEKELLKVLEAEYDSVTLFLRSKQGEIERRLAHVEKQVKIAQRAIESNALDKPILQARRYRQLVKDNEEIGDEIQNLSRFAAVQKTAFRKILKKYRKWTGSTALQTRLDVEVFAPRPLQTDFADYLQQWAELTAILTDDLAGPMLTGQRRERSPDPQQKRISASAKRSPIAKINDALLRGPLPFDAALVAVPYGEAAGSAFYWIHPDNLDEVRALLLRYMRDVAAPPSPSRKVSDMSLGSRKGGGADPHPGPESMHQVVFDNAERLLQDPGLLKPSRVALSGHWNEDPDAVVALAGLSPAATGAAAATILGLTREELADTLQRNVLLANPSNTARDVGRYLIEHRDLKPLAELCASRARYAGMNNTADVANWATLDTAVTVTAVDLSHLGDTDYQSAAGDAFPHAVLHIRWEFARTPEVVRAFDESHLVERVLDFTLETMAVHLAQKRLPPPPWQSLLEKDIRKVPALPYVSRAGPPPRRLVTAAEVAGTSSGPSSSEGQTDSVFSAKARGYSSVTSADDAAAAAASSSATVPKSPHAKRPSKKRARIKVPLPTPPPARYWNEFDDGELSAHAEDGYIIYVDPNEEVFPGAETISRAMKSIYSRLAGGTRKALLWLPFAPEKSGKAPVSERTPLFHDQLADPGDADSSDSDTDEARLESFRSSKRNSQASKRFSAGTYRPNQLLSPRQKALEQTLFVFYTGLISVSYILLIMAVILRGTGRKKAFVQVDAGVIAGVVSAEACTIGAVILIFMRKQTLGVLHWGIVAVAIAGSLVLGVSLLAIVLVGARGRAIGKDVPVTNQGELDKWL